MTGALRYCCVRLKKQQHPTTTTTTMEGLQKGWYSEVSAFSPGQAMSIEVVGEPLHHEKR